MPTPKALQALSQKYPDIGIDWEKLMAKQAIPQIQTVAASVLLKYMVDGDLEMLTKLRTNPAELERECLSDEAPDVIRQMLGNPHHKVSKAILSRPDLDQGSTFFHFLTDNPKAAKGGLSRALQALWDVLPEGRRPALEASIIQMPEANPKLIAKICKHTPDPVNAKALLSIMTTTDPKTAATIFKLYEQHDPYWRASLQVWNSLIAAQHPQCEQWMAEAITPTGKLPLAKNSTTFPHLLRHMPTLMGELEPFLARIPRDSLSPKHEGLMLQHIMGLVTEQPDQASSCMSWYVDAQPCQKWTSNNTVLLFTMLAEMEARTPTTNIPACLNLLEQHGFRPAHPDFRGEDNPIFQALSCPTTAVHKVQCPQLLQQLVARGVPLDDRLPDGYVHDLIPWETFLTLVTIKAARGKLTTPAAPQTLETSLDLA